MTTALSTTQQNQQIQAAPEASFGQLVSMGVSLRKTGFLPAHIKTGEDFAAIVLIGRELGMSTMAACRHLQCIKGTVTERADSQLARFKTAGGRARFETLDASKAILWVRHPNGDEHTETFTMDDAQKAGLGGNDNYKKHPKAKPTIAVAKEVIERMSVNRLIALCNSVMQLVSVIIDFILLVPFRRQVFVELRFDVECHIRCTSSVGACV